MERLTRRENGEVCVIDRDNNYKEDITDVIIKALHKLADYEDVEEYGLLVRLPCKVGDTVYVIYCGYVTSAKVMAVYIDYIGGMFDLKIKTNKENSIGFENIIDGDNYTFNDIGKTVFLNREEAEQALEDMCNE